MNALLKFLQDNPVWQFVINAIIALLTAIVTVVVPIWIYLRGRERRRIFYKILDDTPSSFLVKVASEQRRSSRYVSPRSRSISLKGHKIVLEIWNAGNTSVLPDDYILPITLSFGELATILEARIVRTSPESIENAVLLEYDAEQVILGKPLLNSKDSIILSIWLSGSSSKLIISSRVKGINNILEFRKSKINSYVFILSFISLFFIVLYLENLAFNNFIFNYFNAIPRLYIDIFFDIILASLFSVYIVRYTISGLFYGFTIKVFEVKYLSISILLMSLLFFIRFINYHIFRIVEDFLINLFILATVPASVLCGVLYDEFEKINKKSIKLVVKLVVFLIFSLIIYIILIKISI